MKGLSQNRLSQNRLSQNSEVEMSTADVCRTAFVFWIISSVLLLSVVCYGAFMFCLTGVAMVLTCVVYHVCQPPIALTIHFGDSVLTTRYGWCFWLTLASGQFPHCLA